MKTLFKDLESAVKARLLNINNEIRKNRKQNKDIKYLVLQRKETDKLLSNIRVCLIKENLDKSSYEQFKNRFLLPFKGDFDVVDKYGKSSDT